jgi:hypothetical protein
VLAAEGVVNAIAQALEECRATLGEWAEHEYSARDCVRAAAGDARHLAAAGDLSALLAGYDEGTQRTALAALLRGRSGLDFKSTIYARQIAQSLPNVPATVATMIELVHKFAAGDPQSRGAHDL